MVRIQNALKVVEKENSSDKFRRFWWTGTEWEAKAFTEALLDHPRLPALLEAFLNNPYSCKGELEYELQSLCESIDEKSRNGAVEERKNYGGEE